LDEIGHVCSKWRGDEVMTLEPGDVIIALQGHRPRSIVNRKYLNGQKG
jgi:hypothetical protein